MYPLSFISRSSYLSFFFRQHAIQKQFPLSVFVFIDSLLVSASQDAGGYAISGQNNLKLPYLYVAWVIYIGMPVVRPDGRAGGQVYGHVTTKISRMHRLPNFFTHGGPLRARESSSIKRVYYRNDFND